MHAKVLDLFDIANRMESDEKFILKYKIPITRNDGSVIYESRQGKLLDVAEHTGRLYVDYRGKVIWVHSDEVEELVSDSG
jgi:hypothetical protein